VGVAGLGRSGWDIHVRALRQVPDQYKVVTVLDSLEARRRQAAEELGCRTCGEYEQLLADDEVELVVVAMPTDLHVSWAIRALEAGRHVVVEKPVGRDLAECDRLMGAESKSGLTATVFQNRRYEPRFLKIRELVEGGVLGRVNFIRWEGMSYRRRWDWQTVRGLGGGALRNTGIHMLDQMMEFSGEAEPEVHCRMDNVLSSGDAEDWVQLILTAPDAPTMEIDIFSNCTFPRSGWLVLGRKGSLTSSGGEVRWKVVSGFEDLPERKLDLNPTADRSYNSEQLEFEEFTWKPEESRMLGANLAFYRDLYAQLREGAARKITLAGVRRRMAVVDRCLRLWEG
jgi:predicted dehydrogenase